ncbi:MAG TPA: flagellar type III secretion system pore protein FliP [Bryobacteraceae bacterium]|jgi:flagellar biosynthetic protein FliP|nr:flagellar type III secretion system pore protein FliP [Bryobacteraceae bacterium]
MKRFLILFLGLSLKAFAAASAASEPLSLFGISTGKGGSTISAPMQILLLLTVLTLLPGAIMVMTPFLRITIVLHFLRQALGTQTTPSNQVLLGLSMFLTIVLMQPVASDIYKNAWEPMEAGQMTTTQAMDAAAKPLHAFLIKFAREKELKLFVEISHSPAPHTPDDVDMKVLIPAYILSELKTGFQIGAVLFLPFLVIDLVVASVTLSVGMVQLPPAMISAPFKILLFVLVDGWTLVVGSLMKSFY